ncbi:MAG: J domain-containing protein [Oscillospiraceae bacterium]|nr:J domain-containing protein [Oscillospiraceae bacterium]
MSSLVDHYKVLGVGFGASIADVTSSYRRLCRMYHPDISDDPESEELMKKINIAYTVLREKLKREAAIRDRYPNTRYTRRYGSDARPQEADAQPQTEEQPKAQATEARRAQGSDERKAAADAEKEAFASLTAYFEAICAFDYSGAHEYLSSYDKRRITLESFVRWRKSVSRLHLMREFKIVGGYPVVSINWSGGKTLYARKFRVAVTEEDLADDEMRTEEVEKLVVCDSGQWKVFLGYGSVGELTREFDERFEVRKKSEIQRHREECLARVHTEYNMLSLEGLRKEVLREIYRQRRFGGALTFAVISMKVGGTNGEGQEELQRSAAKTICKMLRETDAYCYAGDGVFALVLVELRKRFAVDIVRRIISRIRENAGKSLGTGAHVEFALDSWSGKNTASMDAFNFVLKKFQKMI